MLVPFIPQKKTLSGCGEGGGRAWEDEGASLVEINMHGVISYHTQV